MISQLICDELIKLAMHEEENLRLKIKSSYMIPFFSMSFIFDDFLTKMRHKLLERHAIASSVAALSLSPPLSISTSLSVSLFVFSLFLSLSVSLYLSLSLWPSLSLSLSLFSSLSISLTLSLSLSVCLSVSPSHCLSQCLSVSIIVSLCLSLCVSLSFSVSLTLSCSLYSCIYYVHNASVCVCLYLKHLLLFFLPTSLSFFIQSSFISISPFLICLHISVRIRISVSLCTTNLMMIREDCNSFSVMTVTSQSHAKKLKDWKHGKSRGAKNRDTGFSFSKKRRREDCIIHRGLNNNS